MYCIRTDVNRKRVLYQVQAPSVAISHRAGLLWLELVGPEQAVRAIWAFLVKHRNKRTLQTLDSVRLIEGNTEKAITINPLTKYHMIPTPTGLVMLHEGFNRLEGKYMLGGDEEAPSPWFRASFQRLVAVPFLPQWIDELWHQGIAERLISEPYLLHGPVQVWRLNNDTYTWEKLVSKLIKEGVLHG